MKKKRKMRQLLAMMLSLIMMFAPSMSVWASETNESMAVQTQGMQEEETEQIVQEQTQVLTVESESTLAQESTQQTQAEEPTNESSETAAPSENESLVESSPAESSAIESSSAEFSSTASEVATTENDETKETKETKESSEVEETPETAESEENSEIEETEDETEEESEEESTSESEEEDLLDASGVSVKITGCTINGGNLCVTAVSNTSGHLYLFDLETYEDTASFKERKALTSISATANTTFTVTVSFKEDYLTDKFVFGVSKSGKCVSNAMYITNPEALAYTSVLHTANSKKGLLLYETQQGIQDAVTLGVKHSTVTALISNLVNPDGSLNSAGISTLKSQATTMAQNGIVVYLILVLPVNASSTLRYPGSDGGTYFAAWNTGENGAAIYENLMRTLARELSGVVSHWIIGNEVNDNIQWNYMGPADITKAVSEYAKTFRLCYNAIRSVNASANLYVPVDHRWNQNANTMEKYDTRAYLNAFDQYIQSMGNIDWCLAFHAYSIPLGAPEVWDDGQPVYAYDGTLLAGGGEISFDENTFAISMRNIDILTNYFCNKISRNTKGQVRPISLTEQGWTSYSQRTNADAVKDQATSLAYAYYKAESNPYIECLIVSRQMDALEMGNPYYKFGMRTDSWLPKYSWEVFKNLGTSASIYSSAALPVITEAKARCTGRLLYPTTVSSSWNAFYNAAVNNNDNITLGNAATNDKVLSMKLNGYNAAATPYFGAGIKVRSGSAQNGSVMLRVFSGEKLLELSSDKLVTDRQQYFLFDLSSWAGISNITGVELWVRGISSASSMAVTELNCSASSEIDWSSIIPRNFSGLMDIDGEWHYFTNGAENTAYDGLVLYNGTWYYVKNGVINWDYTGLVSHNGGWYYVQGGAVNWNYSGLTQYYGTWYYIQKGYLNWNYTNLVQYNKNWYYVQNGAINWNYTGLVLYNKSWYYVQNGAINWNYTGLALHGKTWYYVQGGCLNWNYNGLTYYNGTWYYVQKGMLNWNYTSLVLYNKSWYYVQNGAINWNYTGLVLYYGTWYYIQKGCLNWNYTGPAVYNKSTYYVVNGKIDWNFSRTVTINGKQYVVKNGCVLGM